MANMEGVADSGVFPIATMRHSAAHVLAQAVKELYPDVQLAIGPAIENGFYYDLTTTVAITEADLKPIEKIMRRIVKERQRFERYYLSVPEALEYLEQEGQPFKVEMAKDFEKNKGVKELSFARNVKDSKDGPREAFVDMCNGPHVNHTGEIGHFKLSTISGAYWRGDSKNQQLTRIYGWLFYTKEELLAYEKMVLEARKRDHRKLGKELELFTLVEKVGPGLVFWLPRGNVLREQLENWAKETEDMHGYSRISTPMITKEDLFYTSEHLPHYKDHMFPPMEMDNTNYYIKPMNCPFHHMIFSSKPRSYRELPLRLSEYGVCHRYEDSGSLFGTMRVRAMQMNDAHIYCSEENSVEEFVKVIELHKYYYDLLGIKEYWMELSLRNPENDKYHGDQLMWEKAEKLTKEAMEKSGVPYKVVQDGAAFYGPKMDFQIKSSIGREFTTSTCQLDLFMPEKFDLKYKTAEGDWKRPACIHRSPLGTHERFIGFLIEHFAGAFPLWLAPEQVRILPVSEKFANYANQVTQKMQTAGIRAQIENSTDSLAKRIRTAEKMKINYMLVLGEKEQKNATINYRNYFTKEQKEASLEELIYIINEEVAQKTIQIS